MSMCQLMCLVVGRLFLIRNIRLISLFTLAYPAYKTLLLMTDQYRPCLSSVFGSIESSVMGGLFNLRAALVLQRTSTSTSLLLQKGRKLSPFDKDLFASQKKKMKIKNITASLLPRHHYLLCLKLLQLFMKLGLEVSKVHDVYQCSHHEYLALFISTIIKARRGSTNYAQ